MIFAYHHEPNPEQRSTFRFKAATNLIAHGSCGAQLARHSRWSNDLIDKPFALPTCLGTGPQPPEARIVSSRPQRNCRNSA